MPLGGRKNYEMTTVEFSVSKESVNGEQLLSFFFKTKKHIDLSKSLPLSPHKFI